MLLATELRLVLVLHEADLIRTKPLRLFFGTPALCSLSVLLLDGSQLTKAPQILLVGPLRRNFEGGAGGASKSGPGWPAPARQSFSGVSGVLIPALVPHVKAVPRFPQSTIENVTHVSYVLQSDDFSETLIQTDGSELTAHHRVTPQPCKIFAPEPPCLLNRVRHGLYS